MWDLPEFEGLDQIKVEMGLCRNQILLKYREKDNNIICIMLPARTIFG